jgi:hypothetical protein
MGRDRLQGILNEFLEGWKHRINGWVQIRNQIRKKLRSKTQ